MINSNRDESSPYANLCESHYDEILISSITMTSRIHFHRTTSVPELEWVVDLLCLVVIEIDRRSIFRRWFHEPRDVPSKSNVGRECCPPPRTSFFFAVVVVRKQRRQLTPATSQCFRAALFLITFSPPSFFLPVHRVDLWLTLNYG